MHFRAPSTLWISDCHLLWLGVNSKKKICIRLQPVIAHDYNPLGFMDFNPNSICGSKQNLQILQPSFTIWEKSVLINIGISIYCCTGNEHIKPYEMFKSAWYRRACLFNTYLNKHKALWAYFQFNNIVKLVICL